MNANRSMPGPLDPAGQRGIRLLAPESAIAIDATRRIFLDYAAALEVDLRFQDLEGELATLPGEYSEPRGALLLALVDSAAVSSSADDASGSAADITATPMLSFDDGSRAYVAGCCALRPLDDVDHANAAEMKRLYVRPAFRGLGLGRQLAEAILDAARSADYACVLLDTLDEMETARTLYEELGFAEVPPYYHNPIAGAHYLKVEL